MAKCRVFLTLISVIAWQPAIAAWQASDDIGANKEAIAYAGNSTGQRAEIVVDADGKIELRFILSSGFETFTGSTCPTFQIDRREPLHHFEIGDACVVDDKRVTLELGKISRRKIDSLILYQLMNGDELSFRYMDQGGRYHEAQFTLGNSKQALRRALGYAVMITVEQ